MPLVKRSCIESIKDRVNIYDVASPYVHLKKAGANWVGLSPFTNEKSPSFYVLPEKNIFKCFSSGHAGDIFRFLQLKENLNFQESIEWIARQHSIELEYEEGSAPDQKRQSLRKELFEIHELATHYFAKAFQAETAEGNFIRDYWTQERKFTLELATQAKIGLSPSKDYPLHTHLLKKGYTEQALAECGLFYVSKHNQFRPRFRGRLMIPIRDVQGRVIAFTARKLDITPQDVPSAEAKYINSPETSIFNKSHVLFGLEEARKHANKEEPFVLVEGQLDVLRFWANDFYLAIAPQGTSITENQLSLIKRYTSKLDCFLDGDSAGQKAAMRLLPMAFQAGLEVRFISLSNGQDPDTLLLNGGASALDACRQEGQTPIAFALSRLLPPGQQHSPRAKAEALNELYEIIHQCDSQVVQNECLEEIARRAYLEIHAVEADYKRFKKGQRRNNPQEKTPPPAAIPGANLEKDQKVTTAEYELLLIILNYPEVAKPVAEVFNVEWIRVFSLHSRLLIRFLTELGENIRDNLEPIDELLETDEERNCVYNILGQTTAFSNPAQSANMCIKTIFSSYVNEQKKKLEETIATTPPNEDSALKSLLEERISLRKSLHHPPYIEAPTALSI